MLSHIYNDEEDAVHLTDLPNILKDITYQKFRDSDYSALNLDKSLSSDEDADGTKAFLTELQISNDHSNAQQTINTIDAMLDQWRDTNQTGGESSQVVDDVSVASTNDDYKPIYARVLRRTKQLNSYKIPKRARQYQPNGSSPSPKQSQNSKYNAIDRLNEKLYRLRTNPEELRELRDRVKQHRKLVRRANVKEREDLHQRLLDATVDTCETLQEKQVELHRHRQEVKERHKYLLHQKQVDRFQSCFKLELAATHAQVQSEASLRQELQLQWLTCVLLGSRLKKQVFHLEVVKTQQRGKRKQQRILCLIQNTIMAKVWRRRRRRIAEAWKTFQCHWTFFRLWLPTMRRRECTLIIKSFLQSQFSYVSAQRAVRTFRSRVILIQNTWRRVTNRHKRFSLLLTDQFVDEEKKLIGDEIQEYHKATKKLEKEGKSHTIQRFTIERVKKEDLMDLPPEERRRLKRRAQYQNQSNFRVLHTLRVPEEEMTMFNHQREPVPVKIRENTVEKFYRAKKEELIDSLQEYHSKMNTFHEVSRQADFVNRVKDIMRMGKYQPGTGGQKPQPSTFRHAFADTVAPSTKKEPSNTKSTLLSNVLQQMRDAKQCNNNASLSPGRTMSTDDYNGEEGIPDSSTGNSVSILQPAYRPKRPFLDLYYSRDVIRKLIYSARADVIDILQQKRTELLDQCFAVTEVFYLMQQFKKDLLSNNIDLSQSRIFAHNHSTTPLPTPTIGTHNSKKATSPGHSDMKFIRKRRSTQIRKESIAAHHQNLHRASTLQVSADGNTVKQPSPTKQAGTTTPIRKRRSLANIQHLQ